MRTAYELRARVVGGRYDVVEQIHDPAVGYVAWRTGTGDNLEILFVAAAEKGRGHGKELLRRMCRTLLSEGHRPYHSVYAFRLAGNEEAGHFYASMGWHQQAVGGEGGRTVYGGDGTVIAWVAWDALLQRLGLA